RAHVRGRPPPAPRSPGASNPRPRAAASAREFPRTGFREEAQAWVRTSSGKTHRSTPHPNPPPQGGREESWVPKRHRDLTSSPRMDRIFRSTPSPLVGEGWGGGEAGRMISK